MDKAQKIMLVLIGALVLILIYTWSSDPGEKGNPAIRKSEDKIEELENLITQKNLIIKFKINEKDRMLDSIRIAKENSETKIKVKYETTKNDIISLTDDESIALLRANLGE